MKKNGDFPIYYAMMPPYLKFVQTLKSFPKVIFIFCIVLKIFHCSKQRHVFGGSPLHVIFNGTPTINVFLHFLERSFGIMWFVLFYKAQFFFEKCVKISTNFRKVFEKFNDFRFKMVSSWKILKNFGNITNNTLFRSYLEISKSVENFTYPKSSKIYHLWNFKKQLFAGCVVLRVKKSILWSWDP